MSERNYTLNRLQPFGGNRHAVFLTHARESLDLHYERTLYSVAGTQRADPRVIARFRAGVDEFGNEKKSAAIGYGRRYDDPDPLMIAADRAAQSATLITYTESDYTNPILTDDAYRTSAAGRRANLRVDRLYAVRHGRPVPEFGLREAGGDRFRSGLRQRNPLRGDGHAGRQRRLIKQVRTLYRSDDLQSALPLGTLESLALPSTSYKLALTPGLLASIYQRPHAGQPTENLLPDPPGVLKGKGGYVLTDDQQALGLFPCIGSRGAVVDPQRAGFLFARCERHRGGGTWQRRRRISFLAARYRDIFGNNTTVAFDSYDLLPAQVMDPVQNAVTASSDYRVLQPAVDDRPERQSIGGRLRCSGPGRRNGGDGQVGHHAAGFDQRLYGRPHSGADRCVFRRSARPASGGAARQRDVADRL